MAIQCSFAAHHRVVVCHSEMKMVWRRDHSFVKLFVVFLSSKSQNQHSPFSAISNHTTYMIMIMIIYYYDDCCRLRMRDELEALKSLSVRVGALLLPGTGTCGLSRMFSSANLNPFYEQS